jgi:dipeptide/tripeptide permease
MLFAIGEMICSPRIQEYITWIAPKEKAGLYMGANFLGTMVGALSGIVFTSIYGTFHAAGAPERVWYVLGGHYLVAVVVFWLFIRFAGEFKEQAQ